MWKKSTLEEEDKSILIKILKELKISLIKVKINRTVRFYLLMMITGNYQKKKELHWYNSGMFRLRSTGFFVFFHGWDLSFCFMDDHRWQVSCPESKLWITLIHSFSDPWVEHTNEQALNCCEIYLFIWIPFWIFSLLQYGHILFSNWIWNNWRCENAFMIM